MERYYYCYLYFKHKIMRLSNQFKVTQLQSSELELQNDTLLSM